MRVRTGRRRRRRRGGQMVEAALVLPVLITILVGLVIGSSGVFSNSQVAMLANEGARWASVHGPTYASESGNPAATSATVMTSGILPVAAGLQRSSLTATLTWSADGVTWNSNATNAKLVKVVVTYQWKPLIYFSPTTMGSTSVMAVTY